MDAQWDYGTLAPVLLLDRDLNELDPPDLGLYTCTFSTDDDRYGYIIVSYGEGKEGPYISNRSLCETTPYQYDLRANIEAIAEALEKTDMDLTTAAAVRAEWMDAEKKHSDPIILFTDGKGDKYVCVLGESGVTVKKQ